MGDPFVLAQEATAAVNFPDHASLRIAQVGRHGDKRPDPITIVDRAFYLNPQVVVAVAGVVSIEDWLCLVIDDTISRSPSLS